MKRTIKQNAYDNWYGYEGGKRVAAFGDTVVRTAEQAAQEWLNGTAEGIKFSRVWAMPNSDTFKVPVIGEFVRRHMANCGLSVDPFSRNNKWATLNNDLNPATQADNHLEARVFLKGLVDAGVKADLFIFDPPYSPRQISECYASAGMKAGMADTQNARLVKGCRDLIRRLAKPGSVCLSFGWNSAGMGKGWNTTEIMLVAHGGCHNDTICMAETNTETQTEMEGLLK